MSAALEARYRSVLQWYPRAWRDQHEAVILGTLLDVAEAGGRTQPTFREMWNLAVNGLGTRLGGILPASLRDGVAGIALATGFAYSLVYLIVFAWAPWTEITTWSGGPALFGPFANTGMVVSAAWAVAFIAAMLGKQLSAKIALVIVIVLTITLPVVTVITSWDRPTTTHLALFALFATLAVIGTPDRRKVLPVTAVIATLSFTAILAINDAFRGAYHGDRLLWVRGASPVNLGAALWLALTVAVVLAVIGKRTTAGIIVVSATPWAVAWIAGVINYSKDDTVPILAAMIAVTTIIGLAILVADRRHSRTPPSVGV